MDLPPLFLLYLWLDVGGLRGSPSGLFPGFMFFLRELLGGSGRRKSLRDGARLWKQESKSAAKSAPLGYECFQPRLLVTAQCVCVRACGSEGSRNVSRLTVPRFVRSVCAVAVLCLCPSRRARSRFSFHVTSNPNVTDVSCHRALVRLSLTRACVCMYIRVVCVCVFRNCPLTFSLLVGFLSF